MQVAVGRGGARHTSSEGEGEGGRAGVEVGGVVRGSTITEEQAAATAAVSTLLDLLRSPVTRQRRRQRGGRR